MMPEHSPLILWLRRDLRLSDHPMLAAAQGRMVVPVFVLDPETEALGAAPKWRLGLGLEHFAQQLERLGLRLILRRGAADVVLHDLAKEIGAQGVWWSRLYDPQSIARDTKVKSTLSAAGFEAKSFEGHLCQEPWVLKTGQGGFYRVYTPYWKALYAHGVPQPYDINPQTLRAPQSWPQSLSFDDLDLGAQMGRGAAVVLPHCGVGEDAAQRRLARFLDGGVAGYKADRDRFDLLATSRLSENLTYGEIGPRQLWHAALGAMQRGAAGAEHFLKEVTWREFAYHLLYHTPEITQRNWRDSWDSFPWRADNPDAENWRRAVTGVPIVDAALREMYITGYMHNRGRMLVASYLTKHLMTDWRVGLAWFAQCLVDWDPAANALGWQWTAGSGPDAAPYFRIYNPDTQAEKFDPEGHYRRQYLGQNPLALSYFDAVPRAWGLAPDHPYPAPPLSLSQGRDRAMAAYAARNTLIS